MLATIDQLSIRGREFSDKDLNIIKRCVEEYFHEGRSHISRKICEELNWKQPNGWLKDRACRDVLLKLNELRIIDLPKSKRYLKKTDELKDLSKELSVNDSLSFDYLIDLMPRTIKLKFAKGNNEEILWNNMVNQFHYLGHKVTVGRCIKYLVYGDGQLLGAIAFSSPANRLANRDDLLEKKFGFSIEDIKTYVINNTRFLILPNVKVKNLASSILSKATQQIVYDWRDYYSVEPVIVETFVQISKFEGTCYKAANWRQIGETRGYSKKGNDYVENNEPKKIFLYGLNARVRKLLKTN